MPLRITPQQYGQAVLDYAQSGAYPDDEDIISAELSSSVLPDISSLIRQAREEAENEIKQISKSSATDVEGWIRQAKHLRVDIQRSQETAKEIVQLGQHGERLNEEASDATGKVNLLNRELIFNESLVRTLERLQALRRTLDLVQKAIIDDQPLEAVDLLENVALRLPSSTSGAGRVTDVLKSRVADFRKETGERLMGYWHNYIHVDKGKSSISIKHPEQRSGAPHLESISEGLIKLGIFGNVLLRLSQDIESLILIPRLQIRRGGIVAELFIENEILSAAGSSSDLSAQSLFEDLNKVINFLRSRLPDMVVEPLAAQFIPSLVLRLISTWLDSSIPESLDGMDDFQDTMELANMFSNKLREYKWPGTREMADWMGSIPITWFKKRQQTTLSQVRKLLSNGFGSIHIVERVETQVLQHDDELLGGDQSVDEWNAGWSDDDPVSPVKMSQAAEAVQDDEAGVGAWGLDDEKGAFEDSHRVDATSHTEDEADAWGWNEDDNDRGPESPMEEVKSPAQKPKEDRALKTAHHNERAVTLRETYHITSLPKGLLEIIEQVILDNSTLESPSRASFPVASAAPELLTLPGSLLAMYRASASSSYAFRPNGSMFLYNDSLWLAERLQHMSSDPQQMKISKKQTMSRTSSSVNLEAHIFALENHGKRSYAKERESQRTIITDLLDGAQGFSTCTVHPFNQECDIAIASTVDRIRFLDGEWKVILSHSALLQSLGSLLTTVMSKMIVEIEDMTDISEPESQRLSAYCSRILALEDLFISQAQPADNDAAPAAAFYVSNWSRFQFLAKVLESSLVNIKSLWTESELALEFQTDELVDLILALFADSPHRRTAIGEIRAYRS